KFGGEVIKMLTNNVVTQSNRLIEAKHTHSLTLREQKIVLTFVSMIQPDDEDFKIYSLSVREFYKLFDLKGREHYTHMKGIIKKLMEKTIEIPREDGGYLITHWAAHVEYIAGKGVVQFSFHPKLKPYLLQLKRTFTSYKLINILSLGSYYSIRLYELLKKWERTGKWETTVDYLKELMSITQKSYNVYGNLKNRIIGPATEELNNKTDLKVTFKEIKKGRRVVKLVFNIKQVRSNILEYELLDQELRVKTNTSTGLLGKLNQHAEHYQIDSKEFNRIYSIASKIYEDSKIDTELMGLITYTNKNANKNPIGFMIHILKHKEEIYNGGGDASIVDNELRLEEPQTEVIPEWFDDKDKHETTELDWAEKERMKAIVAKHSQ